MTPTILVGIGGAFGAIARHAVYEHVDRETPIPRATLVVNVLGSAVLGLATGLGASGVLGGDALLLVGTGACGAFTTFSTFAFETVDRHDTHGVRTAATNAIGTVALATLAVVVGLWIGSTA